MAGKNSNLEGLLRWSLAQTDGTVPPQQISEEDKKWFHDALSSQVVDVVQRMKEISTVMAVGEEALLTRGVTVDELAGMLEELQEHVESIDMANDLKAVGGLDPLLAFLRSQHAVLRARAAEVVTTMVQNNPKAQQAVMHAGGLVLLCDNFLRDSDAVVRTKALGAISSLIRHNPEGLLSFRAMCGTKALLAAVPSDDVRLRRKVLHVLKYLLEEYPTDRKTCLEEGAGQQLASSLSDPTADIRTGAADVLRELARSWPDGQHEKAAVLDAVNERLNYCESLSRGEREEMGDEKEGLLSLKHSLVTGPTVDGGSVSMGSQSTSLLLGPPPRD